MNSLSCDVVILPTDDLAQKAISLSEQLAAHDTLYTLQDGVSYPHASLYMMQLKIEDLDKIQAILADIANNTPRLNLT